MSDTVTPKPPTGPALPTGCSPARSVLVTAAAGTGIGFATAQARCRGRRDVSPSATSTSAASARPPTRSSRGHRDAARSRCRATSPSRPTCSGCSRRGRASSAASTCSSTTPASAAPRSLVDMTDEQWDTRARRDPERHVPLHARGAAPHDPRRHGGVIVNNASVLGWRAQAGQAHYAAAKAGVMALTRCAAIEAAPHGVRVNAVAPSLAMHPFLAKVTTRRAARRARRRARRSAAPPSRGRSPT